MRIPQRCARVGRVMGGWCEVVSVVAEEGGNSLVELALMLSLFGMPLLIGTVEFATLSFDSIEISNAAHVGTMYGMRSATFAGDTAGMQSAARAEAADFGANLTVTSATYFACSSNVVGTQYATQALADAACSGAGNHSLEFVTVTAQTSVTPSISLPLLPKTYSLSNTSVMEVEE